MKFHDGFEKKRGNVFLEQQTNKVAKEIWNNCVIEKCLER